MVLTSLTSTADPATIAEQRESLQLLVRDLVSRGFADLLTALGDPACLTGAGRFNIAAYARSRRITERRASALLSKLRQAAREFTATSTTPPSRNSSPQRTPQLITDNGPRTLSQQTLSAA